MSTVDRLTETFATVLQVDTSSLSDASSPENTPNWDSLRALQLVAAIEETFNVELTTTEILRMRSLGMARTTLRRKGCAC
jgi:acyl carrier protein